MVSYLYEKVKYLSALSEAKYASDIWRYLIYYFKCCLYDDLSSSKFVE